MNNQSFFEGHHNHLGVVHGTIGHVFQGKVDKVLIWSDLSSMCAFLSHHPLNNRCYVCVN